MAANVSKCLEKGFGGLQLTPMFQALLGEAKVAERMLEGRDGQLTKITKRIICNNLQRSSEHATNLFGLGRAGIIL